jgi:Rrf2 family protein
VITREADYAIRVILYLTDLPDKKLVSTMEISEKMFVPYRFLRKIIRQLTESGFVSSSKGKSGGVCLNKSPDEVSLYDVIEVFDQRGLMLNSCKQQDEECQRREYCPVHKRLSTVQSKIDSLLRETRFSDLKNSDTPPDQT